METSIFAEGGQWFNQHGLWIVGVFVGLALIQGIYQSYRLGQFKKILLSRGFTERPGSNASAYFLERGKVGLAVKTTGRGKRRAVERTLFVQLPQLPAFHFIGARKEGAALLSTDRLMTLAKFLFPGKISAIHFKNSQLETGLAAYTFQPDAAEVPSSVESMLLSHLDLFLDPRVESFKLGEGELDLVVNRDLFLPGRVEEVEALLGRLQGIKVGG